MTEDQLEGVVITIDDVTPYHCAWGIKKWCTLSGLDIRRLIEGGVPAKEVYAFGDVHSREIVERKINGRR